MCMALAPLLGGAACSEGDGGGVEQARPERLLAGCLEVESVTSDDWLHELAHTAGPVFRDMRGITFVEILMWLAAGRTHGYVAHESGGDVSAWALLEDLQRMAQDTDGDKVVILEAQSRLGASLKWTSATAFEFVASYRIGKSRSFRVELAGQGEVVDSGMRIARLEFVRSRTVFLRVPSGGWTVEMR
jgi:hypothetical protein